MATPIEQGAWVEIHAIILQPGERAPQVPDDTREQPLEMRARGFLNRPVALGQPAEITTVTGRRLRGTLVEAKPAYDHGFGPPIPELLAIGGEVRDLLRQAGDDP
jgi:hypothetical protein